MLKLKYSDTSFNQISYQVLQNEVEVGKIVLKATPEVLHVKLNDKYLKFNVDSALLENVMLEIQVFWNDFEVDFGTGVGFGFGMVCFN